MSRITKGTFARYDQNLKWWHQNRLASKNALKNFHQTEEADAVAFYPVGGTPLEGKVKFSFIEKSPASGDKGPENPSTITGRDSISIVRAGENLYDPTTAIVSDYSSLDEDGFINVYRKNTGSSAVYASFYVPFVLLDQSKEWSLIGYLNDYSCIVNSTGKYDTDFGYHAWLNIAGNSGTNQGYYSSENFGRVNKSNYHYTRGIYIGDLLKRDDWPEGSDPTYFFRTLGAIASGYTGSWKFKLAVCEKSSVYAGTINLGNTYYGGEIDLATGLMTVTVFHGVFNSPYTIVDQQTDNTYICFQQAISGDPTHGSNSDANLACNMFSIDGDGEKLFLRGNAGTMAVALRILKSRLDVSGAVSPSSPTNQEWMNAFTAWLNTSNTIEYTYTRETPATIQLSPLALSALAQTSRHEPRLNTVYTDADSIQITYQKSPIRAATEAEQAILSLGGNV